jgi:hypothetical protein
MMKLLALLLVLAPLLAACETSDCLDESGGDYQSSYTPTWDGNAAADRAIEHERQMQRDNCAAAAEGRDRPCYY